MTLKEKIQKKKVTIGSWITLGEPAVAEIMAKSGFDWLAIDMEHSSISTDQCQELIRVIDLCGVAPLVRVGANDPLLVKHAMDAGAYGVIVPMINTADEAKEAVSYVKYPPEGRRGVGLGRAQGYKANIDSYLEWVKNESIVIIQIEHIDAVNELENILSVDGIDGFIVGPYDLSGSLEIPGQFNDGKFKDAMERIISVSQAKNVAAGYHAVSSDSKPVLDKIQQGYKFIAYGVDFLFLSESLSNGMQQINLERINKCAEFSG